MQASHGPPVGEPSGTADRNRGDLQLARDALAGSRDARRQFVERMRCVPRFLAVLNARMGRPFSNQGIEDLVQETLVQIWRRLDSYAGNASLQTWAYRFCHHVMSSSLRARDRRPKDLPFADEGHHDPHVDSNLRFEHIYQALDKIGDRDAKLVRHRHFDRLSFEEIGARLALPASSAKAGYYRALGRLREILEPLRREAGL